MRTGFALLMALGAAVGLATLASAAARGDIFMIRGVLVDVTAASAAEARTRALAQGQAQAFDALMRRLLAADDWPRAPRPDVATLNTLVDSLEVSGEKTSTVRYIATLAVRFHPQGVRSLLKNNGLAFTQTMAPSLLVVPYMQHLGADYLWQADNPWRAAWQAHDLANRLTPYVVAKGDAMDRLMAPPFEVQAAVPGVLTRLAGRYETDGALVAELVVEPDLAGESFLATVRLLGGEREEVVVEGEPLPAGELTVETLALLVERVAEYRDQAWKLATLVRLDQGGEVTLAAPLRGLNDWTELRHRLDRVNLVEAVTLRQLSIRQAEVVVRYVGAWESLRVALNGAGLRLVNDGGAWALYLAEAMPRAAEPVAAQEAQP